MADCLAGAQASASPSAPECVDAYLATVDTDGHGNVDLLDGAVLHQSFTHP
jgi:hypothetical protein